VYRSARAAPASRENAEGLPSVPGGVAGDGGRDLSVRGRSERYLGEQVDRLAVVLELFGHQHALVPSAGWTPAGLPRMTVR
jgi:hypothetical protein